MSNCTPCTPCSSGNNCGSNDCTFCSKRRQTLKDKQELVFNPMTGKLDTVHKFNSDRIITAEHNAAGTRNVSYDAASGQYIPTEPLIVTDNDGNVIMGGV